MSSGHLNNTKKLKKKKTGCQLQESVPLGNRYTEVSVGRILFKTRNPAFGYEVWYWCFFF